MQESDCHAAAKAVKFQIESTPFSAIPGQSKLFLQYQSDPLSLRKYYPSAVSSPLDIADRIPQVLKSYTLDRSFLCDALESMNRRFGAAEKTFEHIHLLRRGDTVAVLTGQQAGFLSGPLYTIYKALSAVKMAEELRCRKINAVPVFWAATEDHDFAEVANAFVLNRTGGIEEIESGVSAFVEGSPVGAIDLDSSVKDSISNLFESMPETGFSAEIRGFIENSWHTGTGFGTAFSRMLSRILSEHGIIFVDPMDERIKKLAAPIYSSAALKTSSIVEAVIARSTKLEADGFHAQVLVEPDYFPLFRHNDAGSRRSLKRIADGRYRLSGEKTEFSLEQLAEAAENEPQKFSPGVMLRPVVQDFLFPAVCYFGGAAEIAYFAQNSEVYLILDRPVTPILHRQSFTIIEAKHRRIFSKYELSLNDLFDGFDTISRRIVEQYVNPGTTKLCAEAEENINTELNRLDQNLSRVNVTLAENLATRRRKILYHIAALRKKFHRVQIEKDEAVNRQLRSAFEALMPSGGLQERTINVATFLNRYGLSFIDWVYQSIDLDDNRHRVIHL